MCILAHHARRSKYDSPLKHAYRTAVIAVCFARGALVVTTVELKKASYSCPFACAARTSLQDELAFRSDIIDYCTYSCVSLRLNFSITMQYRSAITPTFAKSLSLLELRHRKPTEIYSWACGTVTAQVPRVGQRGNYSCTLGGGASCQGLSGAFSCP